MPLHVVESNRMGALLEALDERLGPLELFEPRTVLVPGRHYFSVLKNAIAASRGACFQIDLLTFDSWLARQAGALVPDALTADSAALSAAIFQELVFTDRLSEEAFAPLRDYLRQGKGSVARDVAWQVARALGELFVRYHQERPGLIDAWLRGRHFTDHPLERWQASLCRSVLGDPEEARGAALNFPALRFRDRPEALAPGPLHALVPLTWPRRDREFLATLADHRDVFLYLFSPCSGFFEDVRRWRAALERTAPTSAEPSADSGASPQMALDGDPDAGDHPLLAAWGAPLAEPVTFCHEVTGYQTVEAFREPEGDTNLARVQRAVLSNRPERLRAADDSLVVRRFPSRRDESVAIREDVVARLRTDPSLRLCDFAVVVPEADDGPSAVEALEAVFAEGPSIPLHRVRRRSDSESLILETVERLLALPLQDGLATEVLDLVLRPSIVPWSPEERTLVRRWVTASGVIRGWRDADFLGLDPALRTHSWERALRRLALGATAAPGSSLFLEVPGAGTLGVRALDFSADQWPLLARLITAVHGLRRFCEACGGRRTVPDWMAFLAGHLEDLVTPLTERDDRLLSRCLEVLRGHARRPVWRWRDPELTFGEVLPVVASDLTALRTVHSPWGERGVWVGASSDLGILPFVHVWFAGLEDGAVAREVPRSPLDVRAVPGIPGREPSPREAELARFLAGLCHAGRSATFSWCCRDPATGDPVAPATVVRELVEGLSPPGSGWPGGLEAPASGASTHGGTLRSGRVSWLAGRLAASGFDPGRLEPSPPEELGRFLRLPEPPEPRAPSSRVRRHRWRDLAGLWRFPLQAAARAWILRQPQEPEAPSEQEPEALEAWVRAHWFARVVDQELVRREKDDADTGEVDGTTGEVDGTTWKVDPLEAALDAFLDEAAAQAWSPVGVHGAALRTRLLSGLRRTVRSTLAAVDDLLPEPADRRGLVRLHPGQDPAVEPRAIPPVRPGDASVLLSGTLPWFHPGRGVLLLLDTGSDEQVHKVCEAWVALCVLRLLHPGELPPEVSVRVVRPFSKAGGDLSWRWPMPGPGEAAGDLARLSTELVNPENLAFFPMELALEWLSGEHGDFGAWYGLRAPTLLEAWREGSREAGRFEPLWDLGPRIDPEGALALARRIYLDPEAPVAGRFLGRILPVIGAGGARPAGPDEEEDGGEDDA